MKRHTLTSILRVGAVVCYLCVGVFAAYADDSALKGLETAMRDEASKAQNAAQQGSRILGSAEAVIHLSNELRAAIARDQPEQIENVLARISESFRSAAVLAASLTLSDQLRQQREAKEQAMIKSARELLAKTCTTLQTAATPAQLDDCLLELSRTAAQSDHSNSTAVRAELGKVQQALQFTIGWQNYLSNQRSGNFQEALEDLKRAADSNVPELFPRSVILARIEELKIRPQVPATDPTRAILAQLKTCEDIAAALTALNELRKLNGGSRGEMDPIEGLYSNLRQLALIYNDVQAGLPVRASVFSYSAGAGLLLPAEVLKLKAQLMRLVLVRQLGADKLDPALAPGTEEAVDDYLDRTMASARLNCDARLILRVREAQNSFDRNRSPFEPSMLLQPLLAAQNQEEAGQFVAAVLSYQSALKSGSDLVPAKAVGDRLDAIKVAHPADFDKAMQLMNSALSGH